MGPLKAAAKRKDKSGYRQPAGRLGSEELPDGGGSVVGGFVFGWGWLGVGRMGMVGRLPYIYYSNLPPKEIQTQNLESPMDTSMDQFLIGHSTKN